MAGELALWAVRQDIKDPVAKLVLVALADHCNEATGECFPKHGTLADYVRRSKVYIREKIRFLEAEGWIKRQTCFSGKRQTANLYTINLDRGESTKDYYERKKREAAEKAQKRSRSTSSGDARPSPKSSGDDIAAPPPDAPPSPNSVLAGQHPMNNTVMKSAPARAIDKSPPVKEVDWRNRLANYRRRAIWPAAKWGPPMHTPGCLVPPDLVRLWDDTQGKAFAEEAAPPAYQSRKPQKAWRRAGASIN
jgi:hypothetical protein